MKIRVLVVDDHTDIRLPLARFLSQNGMEVDTAADAAQARDALSRKAFDIIVLDIMLPDESGLTICRDIAKNHDIPVIFLTARSSTPDRIVGLESGADDYVVKPFDPLELAARINTVLRRQQKGMKATKVHQRFMFDGWTFDLIKRELHDVTGNRVDLSEGEFNLLSVLVRNPNMVFTRDQLLELTQAFRTDVFDRAVDTQVSRLRKKLEIDPRKPALLKTSWGNGYIFAADVKTVDV